MGIYHYALENITDFSCAQNWVSDRDVTDVLRTVSGSEFPIAGLE